MKIIEATNLSGKTETYGQDELQLLPTVIWEAQYWTKNPQAKELLNKAHQIVCSLLYGKVNVIEYQATNEKN